MVRRRRTLAGVAPYVLAIDEIQDLRPASEIEDQAFAAVPRQAAKDRRDVGNGRGFLRKFRGREDLLAALFEPPLSQGHHPDHAGIRMFGRVAKGKDAVFQQDQPLHLH